MNDVEVPPATGARGAALGAMAVAGSGAAAALAAGGRLGIGAVAAGVGGAATYASSREPRPTRLATFAAAVLPRLPDAAIMAGIAWHFRNGGRIGAVAASVVALTFLASYARTRALSLDFACETPSADSLRYTAAVAALAVPGGAEAGCWVLAGLTSVEFLRIAAETWKNASDS